ncbi:MAG: LysE family translocator [Rhodoferax sp.]|nr:LysE family translocator [Rhodoferax sp.]
MDALLTLPQLSSFLLTALLLALAPGPDNLMVLSLGMSQGRRPGIAFGLGCALGCLSHTLLAALGVSALIAASPTAFQALRLAGGLYLLWLGVQALRQARPLGAPAAGGGATVAPLRLLLRGVLANAINPKVILFFLALLPQFVVGERGQVGLQIGLLGLLFTLTSGLVFAAIGWWAGGLGDWLTRRPGIGAWLDRAAGGVFIALGLRLMLGD